jgi:hypothetical protein
MLVTQPVCAEWERISSPSEFALYIDQDSVKSSDAGRRARFLRDYKKAQTAPDGRNYRSTIGYEEIDCAGNRIRTLAVTFKTDQMGRGEDIYSYEGPPDRWYYTPPNSIAGSQTAATCAAEVGQSSMRVSTESLPAGFTLFGYGPDAEVIYVNFSRIDRRAYPLRDFWAFMNRRDGRSVVSHEVADCSNGSMASVHVVAFTKHFGKGIATVIKNEKDGEIEFKSIPVKSSVAKLIQEVCQ